MLRQFPQCDRSIWALSRALDNAIVDRLFRHGPLQMEIECIYVIWCVVGRVMDINIYLYRRNSVEIGYNRHSFLLAVFYSLRGVMGSIWRQKEALCVMCDMMCAAIGGVSEWCGNCCECFFFLLLLIRLLSVVMSNLCNWICERWWLLSFSGALASLFKFNFQWFRLNDGWVVNGYRN